MILEIVLTVLLGWLSYIMYGYIGHVLKLKNYPPGPFPLPVIGNLNLMGLKPYEIFRDMAKKYGDVFSISLGMERVVIVNSIDPAREALITKGTIFAGRPNNHYTGGLISRGYKDIAFTDYGPLWHLTRKLGHAALKLFGDGLGNLETKVVSECEELRIRLQENVGKPVDVTYEYGLAVQNVICSMVFGNRYHREDPEFIDMLNVGNLMTAGFSNGDPVAFLPWLRFFPFEGLRKLRQAISIRDPLYSRKLKEHRDTFDPENIRDFTDSLLKSSLDEELWKNVGLKEGVTDDHLEMIINDVFLAGAETTTTTLRWLSTYLLHWPHFQEEIFDEIIHVVGVDRYPELKDRPKMPLMQATLQETLRLSSLVPLGVPHKATEDSSISGLNIPKGTQILFNLWNLHHDPAQWDKPEEFNPRRWLDGEGKYIPGEHKSFLPFSAGRRVCLGESMAKTELFLIASRLLRDFKLGPNLNEPFPSLQGRIGVTLSPNPFSVIFQSRGL